MDAKDAIQRALGYYELGLLSEADSLLETLESGEPSVDFQHLRILVKIDRCEWEVADSMAQEAMSLFPERAFGYIQRAYVLHELGRTSEASTILDKVPNDPTDSVEDIVHYNKACYLACLGQLDAALENLREALKHNETLLDDALEDPDLEAIRVQIRDL